MMAPVGLGMRFSRLKTLRASSKGQALLTWAWARNSELTSILGVALAFAAGAAKTCALTLGMLASACKTGFLLLLSAGLAMSGERLNSVIWDGRTLGLLD